MDGLRRARQTELSRSLRASTPKARRKALLEYVFGRIATASQVPIETIHADLHLLDAGLDSVSGADLVASVEAELGVSVPLSAVFDNTIDSLTGYILEQVNQNGSQSFH